MRRRKVESTRFLLMAAKLIAPVIDRASGKLQGYDWVAEQCHSLGYSALAHEMEMAKAIQFLSGKEFDHAIEVLKAFERKEQHLKARAATNLSFLYFLEGELKEADKYAEMGVSNDRYNARALVNRANCLVERGDVQGAKALCLEVRPAESRGEDRQSRISPPLFRLTNGQRRCKRAQQTASPAEQRPGAGGQRDVRGGTAT